ncbi:hypothetical protein EWM64_g6176 [Hericium alpestre]|uniref:Cobalamin-independent methionine synthase MetE C-terminal/archaeal domain-containing protein n=1 Tax=Hericium alpestre TaxID=135208 RepID=A0A4Y9ZWH1_9AGAM|nr:hypothetical protein EWM64_g6176 [Hericium alpestre]
MVGQRPAPPFHPHQRTSPPFRAEQIGSLRRPDELVKKRLAYDAGACSKEELEQAEDRAIKHAVDLQREAGVKTITDGEFRRRYFYDGFWDSLDGMTFVPQCPPEKFSQLTTARRTTPHPSWMCTGRLKRSKPIYGPQFDGLKKFVTSDVSDFVLLIFDYFNVMFYSQEVPRLKIAMAAPEFLYIIHREHTYDEGVYNNIDEYFDDLVKIYREEIADLYARGCRNLQIDDPWLTFLADERTVTRMMAAGIDIDDELTRFIRLLNDCLEGRPKDMTVGLHLCRNNARDGRYFAEGSYETIAVRLFNELKVDIFYLEYDSEKASLEPLRFFPTDKLIVLGLVATKNPELEDPDDLELKVHEAAHTIAHGQHRTCATVLDQICISPQCGFASSWEGHANVPEPAEKRKLQLLNKASPSAFFSSWPTKKIGPRLAAFLYITTCISEEQGEESAEKDADLTPSSTAPQSIASPTDVESTTTVAPRTSVSLHIAALCWSLFLAGWNDGSIGPLLPRIQEVYHVSYGIVSILFVSTCIGVLCGAITSVWLGGRFGFGKALLFGTPAKRSFIYAELNINTGSMFQVMGYCIQSPGPPFPLFVVAFFFNGFAESLQCAQANGYVASFKVSSSKLGMVHCAYGVGALAAPLVSTQFAQLPRWSFHYLVSLGIAVTNSIVILLVFRLKEQDQCLQEVGEELREKSPTQENVYKQIVRNKTVHLVSLFIIAYEGVEVTVGGWIVTYIINVRGGGSSSGYISSGFFGGLALGRIVLLPLNKKLGNRLAVTVYTILIIGLEMVVWFVPNLIAGAVAISLVGVIMGPMYPIVVNEASLILPPWLLSGSIGWIAGVGTVGSAAVPHCGSTEALFLANVD